MAGYELKPLTITIDDEGGVLAVSVDWRQGRGLEFAASFPTGIHAAYPEARERLHADAVRVANAYRAELLARYPDGVYTRAA